MEWINHSNGKRYLRGALKTVNGVIFNPTEATLKAHGYEPYIAPKAEPVALTKDEIEMARKQAYIQRVDPITAEIERLKEMGGTEDELADARARRVAEVDAIKAEYPYPTEEE